MSDGTQSGEKQKVFCFLFFHPEIQTTTSTTKKKELRIDRRSILYKFNFDTCFGWHANETLEGRENPINKLLPKTKWLT